MLASAAGLDLDDERLSRLSRQWERFLEGAKLLGELDLGETRSAERAPQKEEQADEP